MHTSFTHVIHILHEHGLTNTRLFRSRTHTSPLWELCETCPTNRSRQSALFVVIMPTIMHTDPYSTLTLCHIALDANHYISRTFLFEYEGHKHADDIKKSLESIEVRNQKLKPMTRAQLRSKMKPKKIVSTTKPSSRLTKQRHDKLDVLVAQSRARENAHVGLRTCGAVCYRNNRLEDKYYCANVNVVVDRCAMHAKKRLDTVGVFDPSSSQATYLARSNLVNAGLGVHTNITYRKGDQVAKYDVQCIISRAVYEQEFMGTDKKECDYSFQLSKDAIAIGLTEPVVGQGLGSFLNSSYGNKKYPNNCKFVVEDKSIIVVLDVEGLPKGHELLVPYNRPL
jgi:hypothetical protein